VERRFSTPLRSAGDDENKGVRIRTVLLLAQDIHRF
jgi:hypothetical protein